MNQLEKMELTNKLEALTKEYNGLLNMHMKLVDRVTKLEMKNMRDSRLTDVKKVEDVKK